MTFPLSGSARRRSRAAWIDHYWNVRSHGRKSLLRRPSPSRPAACAYAEAPGKRYGPEVAYQACCMRCRPRQGRWQGRPRPAAVSPRKATGGGRPAPARGPATTWDQPEIQALRAVAAGLRPMGLTLVFAERMVRSRGIGQVLVGFFDGLSSVGQGTCRQVLPHFFPMPHRARWACGLPESMFIPQERIHMANDSPAIGSGSGDGTELSGVPVSKKKTSDNRRDVEGSAHGDSATFGITEDSTPETNEEKPLGRRQWQALKPVGPMSLNRCGHRPRSGASAPPDVASTLPRWALTNSWASGRCPDRSRPPPWIFDAARCRRMFSNIFLGTNGRAGHNRM